MTATSTGRGYWFVAADGGIWSSVDGLSWRQIVATPDEVFRMVAAGPTGAIAITDSGAVWAGGAGG